MKRKISLLMAIIILITPIFSLGVGEDEIRAYLIADYETGDILEGYNTDEVVEIASITKLMTYLVTMEEIDEGRHSLQDLVSIDEEDIKIGGSYVEMEVGDTYTIDELLNLSLVVSANNATYALAKKIGGTEKGFVKLMNEKAKKIGLESATFYNSTGLPDEENGDQNKMKVTDILTMSRYIIENYPEVLNRTSLPKVQGRITIDGEVQDFIPNTNPILGIVEGVDGLKTGFTNKAGHSLVATYFQEGEGDKEEDLRIIGIIMGTKSELERKRISFELMENAREKYKKKKILSIEDIVDTKEIKGSNKRYVDIYPKEDFSRALTDNDEVEIDISLREVYNYPIKKGEEVGDIEVKINGEKVFNTKGIVNEKIKKENIFLRIFRIFIDLIKGLV